MCGGLGCHHLGTGNCGVFLARVHPLGDNVLAPDRQQPSQVSISGRCRSFYIRQVHGVMNLFQKLFGVCFGF